MTASGEPVNSKSQNSVGGGSLLAYQEIISLENLFAAWQEFIRGKRNKPDVQKFSVNLIDNILQLHEELVNKTYKHGGYEQFNISDPKPRQISKASVRDRLVHHAVYWILYPFFDKTFIYDSYSCRVDKGTHRAIRRFRAMFLEVSNYNRKTCWVLKLDIKKFFANIDHDILLGILKEYIPDMDILWLLEEIIGSFGSEAASSLSIPEARTWPRNRGSIPRSPLNSTDIPSGDGKRAGVGLPLGNLTSQLLVNIYMNQFDQFMKHELKVRYYIRYADDFVILSHSRPELINQRATILSFLKDKLRLDLHPDKIILKIFASGIDFLGWVNFPNRRILRTTTKKRMLKKFNENNTQSYLGLLKHGNTHKLCQELINLSWLLGSQKNAKL